MRKRVLFLMLALLTVAVFAGCSVVALGPVPGAITLDQKGPVAGGSSPTWSKQGSAKAEGILLFSWGDASISAAAAAGKITRIHHVDSETMNVLGVYARYETIVYGE